jgi:hypothetical protein
MLTRLLNRYLEYRRVGLTRAAALRLAWIVAWAGAVEASSRRSSSIP